MTMPGPTSHDERPLDLGGLPEEEGVSPGDAAERLEKDPDDQGPDRDRQEPRIEVEDTSLPDDRPADRPGNDAAHSDQTPEAPETPEA